MMLRFHVQTAGSTLTAQQPDVNVVRVSMQALAAVLGGAQSLHTNAKDEALWLCPPKKSARLALRTQQIIAHETGVTNTADPVGGSYYIEQLTDEIERGAAEYIERIDAMGGTLAAIENGLHPERNSERRLCLPAGGGARRGGGGGREPFQAGRERAARDVPAGSRAREAADRAASRSARIARRAALWKPACARSKKPPGRATT